MSRTIIICSFVLLSIFGIWVGRSAAETPPLSSTTDSLSITPAQDIQLSYWEADTNLNGQGLGYYMEAFSPPDGTFLGCPPETRQSYIEFDLTSISFTIDNARLRIVPIDSATGIAMEAEPFGYSLVGYSGSWDETTATLNSPPNLSYEEYFWGVDVTYHPSGYLLLVDTSNAFSQWLQSNQVQNGGDGFVTIGFDHATYPLGCLIGDPIDQSGNFFQDKESSYAPILDVVPEGKPLPEIQPLAVEVSQITASTPSNSTLITLIIATIATIILTIGFTKRRMR